MVKKPDVNVEALRDAMDAAELDFANAKLAYYNRRPYKDRGVEYDDLRGYAERFISASYEFQRAKWSKVRLKLTISRLLRE
jgi:hypothetical protein